VGKGGGVAVLPDAVHYCVHKNPTLVSIPSQMNAIHIRTNFNITLPSTPRSSKLSYLQTLLP
jgi:hypothetical protein